jgi:hypothetical protein
MPQCDGREGQAFSISRIVGCICMYLGLHLSYRTFRVAFHSYLIEYITYDMTLWRASLLDADAER